MPTPSYDSALVAVDRSGSGDLFFDDIEADDGRRHGFRRLGEVSGAEEDLPRHQVREERRRRRKESVAREKRPDVGPERTGGDPLAGRRRKRQKVVEVRRHPPLHALQGPRVHHHGRPTDLRLGLGLGLVLGFQIWAQTNKGSSQIWGCMYRIERRRVFQKPRERNREGLEREAGGDIELVKEICFFFFFLGNRGGKIWEEEKGRR